MIFCGGAQGREFNQRVRHGQPRTEAPYPLAGPPPACGIRLWISGALSVGSSRRIMLSAAFLSHCVRLARKLPICTAASDTAGARPSSADALKARIGRGRMELLAHHCFGLARHCSTSEVKRHRDAPARPRHPAHGATVLCSGNQLPEGVGANAAGSPCSLAGHWNALLKRSTKELLAPSLELHPQRPSELHHDQEHVRANKFEYTGWDVEVECDEVDPDCRVAACGFQPGRGA